MKKLIHVKKHLRKGKVVKSHSRKSTKDAKNKLSVKTAKKYKSSKFPSTTYVGRLKEGRAIQRMNTDDEMLEGNSVHNKINSRGKFLKREKMTRNQIGNEKHRRRRMDSSLKRR